MPEQERIEAIKRFQAHEVEIHGRSVEWGRQRKEDLAKWKSATLTTIYLSVERVSDDFAARGSPFLFASILAGQRNVDVTCFMITGRGRATLKTAPVPD
jgi:hypothetical protein